jgi:hypothetical protein
MTLWKAENLFRVSLDRNPNAGRITYEGALCIYALLKWCADDGGFSRGNMERPALQRSPHDFFHRHRAEELLVFTKPYASAPV